MGWIVCLLPLHSVTLRVHILCYQQHNTKASFLVVHSVTLRVLCSALVLPQFYTALSLLCVMGNTKAKRKVKPLEHPRWHYIVFCSTSSHRHKGEHKAYAVRSSLELSKVP